MTLPPIGSVWTDKYPNYSDPSFVRTILVLGNGMQGGVAMTRVLLIYNNGNIRDESWLTSSFDTAPLLYSPEER